MSVVTPHPSLPDFQSQPVSEGLSLPFPNAEAKARLANRAFELELSHGDLPAQALLQNVIREVFPGRIALVSSFGAESAVLLHLAAQAAPEVPVIFLDTGKLFGETKRYRDQLVARLGLTDVRSVTPEAPELDSEDADGLLFKRDPNRCCFLRKVLPLERALDGFDAWITGRKAFQGGSRSGLPLFEPDPAGGGQRIKINPLANWSQDRIQAYFEDHDLPKHPLEADGFLSIGCMPCTERVLPGEDTRAGRWRGLGKTECGIHLAGTHIDGSGI